MDNLSDSLKCELDSVTSTDSLQLISDEFRLRHLSTPDTSNVELSKRIALLELENERLRTNLENARVELNARMAANEGLKGKITELFIEVQSIQQEKQKLHNVFTDTKSHLTVVEASVEWYQSQVHNLQATKKALQIEIDTYQGILKQKQQTIAIINTRYKQLNTDYTALVNKCQSERQKLQDEIRSLQSRYDGNSHLEMSVVDTTPSSPDMSTKLEAVEDELRSTKTELKVLEQRLLNSEISKMTTENTTSKQEILISTMEESLQKCEVEKNEISDKLRQTQFQIEKLRSENESLQTNLLSSKQEQSQIEAAIFQLKLQLTKMIAQYKLMKNKNAQTEEKLLSMQDLINENKRLRTFSYEANTSLIKKLREEKQKNKTLERKLYREQRKEYFHDMKKKTENSLQECLRHAVLRNQDLKQQLKSLKRVSDESIDEGYADSSIHNNVTIDIPSSSPINTVLLETASDVLLKSKNLLAPVEMELSELRLKIERLRGHWVSVG